MSVEKRSGKICIQLQSVDFKFTASPWTDFSSADDSSLATPEKLKKYVNEIK